MPFRFTPAWMTCTPAQSMGFRQGRLVADSAAVDRYAFALGTCPLTWRQGVKHDAAAVMELERKGEAGARAWRNKLGREVDVEPEHLYPLVKGTDLHKPRFRPAPPRLDRHPAANRSGHRRARSSARRDSGIICRGMTARSRARKSSIYRGQPRVCSLRHRAVQLCSLQGGRLRASSAGAVSGSGSGRGPPRDGR